MKRQELQWWDLVIISLILFGSAIYNSSITLLNSGLTGAANAGIFSSADNWFGIISILIELTLTFIYLKIRNFDFAQWKYKITIKDTVTAVVIFLSMSVAMDIIDILVYGWAEMSSYIGGHGILAVLSEIDISLILFSLLNGTYEEIFFLGICFAIKKEQKLFMLIYSLIIRTSFHTYQGIISALSIGFVIGGIYYFLFNKKDKNLYPYMLSHAFADIFGAGIITLI